MNAGPRESGLVRLSLVRPITMLMAFCSVLVLGVVAVLNIPLEMVPRGASVSLMFVNVPYPNATATDVEERISIPIEQALATTPALEELVVTSGANDSRVTLIFDGAADMDAVYRDVRDRLERVRSELPDGADKIYIRKISTDDHPIAFYGIRWPEGIDDPPDRVQRALINHVERIPGVGQVQVWGNDTREIRIEVDRARAEAAGLNIAELAGTLGQSNFNLASGTIYEGNEKLLLRSVASYASVKELEELQVGPNDLKLQDVADVIYDYPEVERHGRYNGQPSMVMAIIKESQANTVEVCSAVEKVVEHAAKDPRLDRFIVESFFMERDAVLSSLEQVVTSGQQGAIFAIVVLLFFLQRVRLTFVIAASIPLSMFLSLPVMYFSGETINMLSLVGLMICIGLVVDNSVVVAENISLHRKGGANKYAAALRGASEVALPVTLATMTTLIVFAPLALMSTGILQFMMLRVLTPVCVSLIASLFVALVLIPLASVYLYDAKLEPRASDSKIRRFALSVDTRWKHAMGVVYDRTLGRLTTFYGRVLDASLRHRSNVVMLSLFSMMSMAIPLNPESGVKLEGDMNVGGRQLRVSYTVPSNVPLEEMDRFARNLESWFEENRASFGGDGEWINVEPGFMQISMFFGQPKQEDPPFREVGEKIFEQLPVPPGWEKRSSFSEGAGGQERAFPVFIYGDDHETVQKVAKKLERDVLQVKGVVSVEGGERDTAQRDELSLSLDRTLARRFDVSAGMVANTVSYALRGSRLPRYHAEDREVDVSIIYKKSDREQLRDLLQFKVATGQGELLPLQLLTDRSVQAGQTVLVRNNKQVAARLSLEIDNENRQEAIERVQSFLKNYPVPDSVRFDDQKANRDLEEQNQDLLFALLLGIVFIFLLMAFLFESMVLPLSVLPSVPLSAVGVTWFLFVTQSSIDALASVGIILLVGVVVNNGIVLVDFINGARRRGMARDRAIIEAGLNRFRPILMTALTTVGGMLPLAFAETPADGIAYGAFGRVLVGGMTASTVLTLIVVPVCYTFFDDFGSAFSKWTGRILRRNA